MNSFRADLHCHSNLSDGTLSPEQLLRLASEIGLNALSITDHDTIAAYTEEVFALAKILHIELLTGAEFSAVLDTVSVHLLAYNFKPKDPHLLAFCERHKNRRMNRNREILKLLAKHGMPIDEQDLIESSIAMQPLQPNKTIGRPHIAMKMVQLGYVENLQDAFKKYIGDGCPCYVQGESITPQDTLKVIRESGAIAIIAHPHLIKEPKILNKLFTMDIDGIECYYSKFQEGDHQRWLKIAERHNLLITGGSDFHGEVKPSTPLGCSWVNEENFRKLQNYDIHRTN